MFKAGDRVVIHGYRYTSSLLEKTATIISSQKTTSEVLLDLDNQRYYIFNDSLELEEAVVQLIEGEI
jgi:hypothetical protein